MCIIAASVMAISCAVLCLFWHSSHAQMEALLQDKSRLALQFDLAIRAYVAETIRPFAQTHTDADVFIPEVMSTSFVARQVFDKVRKEFPDCIIKFSSDNPRNPNNQAGPEELRIIEYFNNNPKAKTWSGKLSMNGKAHIGLFSARRMKSECLQCHGNPTDAPASLVARYGDKAGFYRPAGEVIALDTIAMPVEKYRALAAKQALRASLVVIVGLLLLLTVVYYAFQRLIGRRLLLIAAHFKKAAKQNDTNVIQHLHYDKNDEIGTVIASFNSMADELAESTTSIDHLNAANSQLQASQHQLQTANAKLGRNEKELRQNMERLLRFNRLAAKRELRMQELKQEINGLLAELGRERKYKNEAEITEIYQSRHMGVEQR